MSSRPASSRSRAGSARSRCSGSTSRSRRRARTRSPSASRGSRGQAAGSGRASSRSSASASRCPRTPSGIPSRSFDPVLLQSRSRALDQPGGRRRAGAARRGAAGRRGGGRGGRDAGARSDAGIRRGEQRRRRHRPREPRSRRGHRRPCRRPRGAGPDPGAAEWITGPRRSRRRAAKNATARSPSSRRERSRSSRRAPSPGSTPPASGDPGAAGRRAPRTVAGRCGVAGCGARASKFLLHPVGVGTGRSLCVRLPSGEGSAMRSKLLRLPIVGARDGGHSRRCDACSSPGSGRSSRRAPSCCRWLQLAAHAGGHRRWKRAAVRRRPGRPHATPGCADGCDETWANGFRNPQSSRDLSVGDAGQNLWEEGSIAVGGGNLGRNVKEGTHCVSTETPDECPGTVRTPHPQAGEMYLPTADETGPTGTTGAVYRLTRPSG